MITDVPRDWTTMSWSVTPETMSRDAVGTTRLMTASRSIMLTVCATVTLNACSMRLMPPKKKHKPVMKSRFEMMLPRSDVLGMVICLCFKSRIDEINCVALLLLSLASLW